MAKAQGFPREARLRSRADFDRVFQEGRRGRGRFMMVCCAPNGQGRARLGVALRRGWRTAVARNRAKRLVREAFRTHKDALPPGFDLVVVPATNWAEPSVAEIAQELIRLTRVAAEALR